MNDPFEVGPDGGVWEAPEKELPDCHHGEPRGWRCHKRRDEKPCAECKRAWARYIKRHRQKGKNRG